MRGHNPLGRSLALPIILLALLAGCDKEPDRYDRRMVLQPKYLPFQPSAFWEDGMSARPLVQGTVPIDGPPNSDSMDAVRSDRKPEAQNFPFKMTAQDLERGREQFEIYCSVCHGRLGDGNGMIPQRGFTHPPSFYLTRLRQAPPGHVYNVITYGFGAMYSYNERVEEKDRWRIAAYISALQLSNPNDNGLSETPPTQRK